MARGAPAVAVALLVARAAQAGLPAIDATLVTGGLQQPVALVAARGDHDRLFVAERSGRVRIIRQDVLLPAPFLDISALVGPSGLFGLAVHPDHLDNGFIYVSYVDRDDRSVIARYQASGADPDVADPASGLAILTLGQDPTASHIVGWIAFGPDGYFWVGSGDGGPPSCPPDRAQDLGDLHGKILRIDVECDGFPEDPLRYYDIPHDNPFVGIAGVRGEIWASGLRQPWRCSFDSLTGDLYIADVGAQDREEINVQPGGSAGGENYGWACMEGSACGHSLDCDGPSCRCGGPGLVAPIHEYASGPASQQAIIGGTVYRGCAIEGLEGTYFFADYPQNSVYALRHDGRQVTFLADVTADLDPPGLLNVRRIASFGEDARGEIHLIDHADGEVFRIVAADPPAWNCSTCPWDLDGNGGVGTVDLLALWAAWGTAPGGRPDFDGDGVVAVTDLLALIGHWGDCPLPP